MVVSDACARAVLATALLALSPLSAAADSDSTAMAVSVITARRACFDDVIQLSGTVVARDEVLVRPDVEGLTVSRVLVEDGATVSAGQPLVQLQRPDWLPGGPASATINASAAGIIMRGPMPIGMPASAKGDPLFRIIRGGELDLRVDVPQSEFARLKAGQAAKVEALGASQLAGLVRLVEPDVDPMTQLGHARIQIRDAKLKPGAFSRASIDAGRVCNTSVPLSAVLYGAQGPIVQVVRGDKVETRSVKVGLFSGKDAEIREGVAAGDVVVARAGAFLREGDPVRAVSEGSANAVPAKK